MYIMSNNKDEYPDRLRDRLVAALRRWREGRHAARTSRELLALYRRLRADLPDLTERELYQRVVMQRTRCDAQAADVLLDNAEQSFAAWPVRRELMLRDVVHYVSTVELLASHDGERWTHINIGRVVDSLIPQDMCVARKSP